MRPVLETPRLLLRRAGPADGAFLAALMNEPAYIENIGDRGVRTPGDAVRYIAEKFEASHVRHGFGLAIVETRDAGLAIGICGLVKRDALERPDLGFAFLRSHWSMGYAHEAAAASLGHATRTLPPGPIHGVVTPANARSVRLLLRLGFHRERAFSLPGQSAAADLYTLNPSPGVPIPPPPPNP